MLLAHIRNYLWHCRIYLAIPFIEILNGISHVGKIHEKSAFLAQNEPKNTKNREMRIFLHITEDTKLHFFEIPYRDTLEGISHVSKKRQKNTFFAQN